MQLLATSRGRVLLLPALGCLCACIVTFFMVLMYRDIGFEASDIGSLLSCIGVTILLVVVCFLGGYAMQARHVLYNEEILLIGKPFRPTRPFTGMKSLRCGSKIGTFLICMTETAAAVSAQMRIWKATGNFIEASLRFTRPEYTAKQKSTPYDNPVSAASGCGTLRYRTGEYYALLILYAVVMFLFFGLTVFPGKAFRERCRSSAKKSSTAPFSFRSCLSAPFWHCFMSVCRKSPTTAKKLLFPVSPPDTNPAAPGYPPA